MNWRLFAARSRSRRFNRGQLRYACEPLEPRQLLAFSVAEAMVVLPQAAPAEQIVEFGDVWRYLDDGSDQGTVWRETAPAFDDTGWSLGSGQLGYGDGDEETVVDCGPSAPLCNAGNFATVYFRHHFQVADQSTVTALTGRVLRDDAAAVFLNGVEVFRDDNLPDEASFDTFATASGGENGQAPLVIDPALLVAGDNVLAVEVHNASAANLDLSFDLELKVERASNDPVELELQFNAPFAPASLDQFDLEVGGVDATQVTVVDATTVRFSLPALPGSGPHLATIGAGAISQNDGQSTPLDPFQLSFVLQGPAQYRVHQQPRLQLGDAPLAPFAGSATDQVDILWQTVPAGLGVQDTFVVQFREADGEAPWMDAVLNTPIDTEVEQRIVHSATATGLAYDSEYEYRVRHVRENVVVETYQDTFRTRLAVGDTTPFVFAAYGDSAYIPTIQNFRAVQGQINQSPAVFGLLLGDNIYNNGRHDQADARFDPLLNPEAAEWIASHIDYFSIGNHDIFTEGGKPSRELFSVPQPVAGVNAPAAPPASEPPEHSFSFDYGDVHFVTFDTNSLNNASRLDDLLTWVEADLAASDATWKIVYGHHPIAFVPDKRESPSDNYYQQVVSRLRAAGVDLFMTGHSHTYSWTKPLLGQHDGQATFVDDNDKMYDKGAGLIQVVSGASGKSLRFGSYSGPGQEAVAAGYSLSTTPRVEHGFAQVEVSPTQITVKYVAADDGQVIDQFSIVDSGDPPLAVDIVDLANNVRFLPVDAMTMVLSEQVPQFDLDDLQLTRDGSGNLLTGGETLSSADDVVWTLSGLQGIASAPGIYTLAHPATGETSSWRVVLLGDFTDSGVVDADDIDALWSILNSGLNFDHLDLDGDSVLTEADATYLVESVLGTRLGDADLDGAVTASIDGGALLANLGSVGDVGWADGDFTGDGSVNASSDGAILLAGLGSSGPGAADLNGDQQANALDIDFLFDQIGQGSSDLALDLNGSGSVDQADVDFLVRILLQTDFGDANLDGLISASVDGAALLASLGQGFGQGWGDGDFSGDKQVTASDDGSLLLSGLNTDLADPL